MKYYSDTEETGSNALIMLLEGYLISLKLLLPFVMPCLAQVKMRYLIILFLFQIVE